MTTGSGIAEGSENEVIEFPWVVVDMGSKQLVDDKQLFVSPASKPLNDETTRENHPPLRFPGSALTDWLFRPFCLLAPSLALPCAGATGIEVDKIAGADNLQGCIQVGRERGREGRGCWPGWAGRERAGGRVACGIWVRWGKVVLGGDKGREVDSQV